MHPKLEKLTLSWSAFELYETCPFKFYQKYVEGKVEPTNIYALYGCAIHSLLDHVYSTGKFNSRYVYSIWPDMLQKEYKLPKKAKQYCNLKQEQVDSFKWVGYKQIKNFFILATEEGLLIPTRYTEESIRGSYKNHKLVVKLDLKLDLPKYGATLIDFKTGKEDKQSFYQLTLYTAMWQKKKQEIIDTIALLYLKTGKIYYKKIDKAFRIEVGNYINNIYQGICNDKEFLPKVNKYCGICYFKDICKVNG